MLTKDVWRLQSDHLQPSSQTLGPQRGGLRPCERSKHHPAHPSDEDCGYCEPLTTPSLGQLYHAYMRTFAIMAYGSEKYAPQPWGELTRDQRKAWEAEAASSVAHHQLYEPGYPSWHPLHVPVAQDDMDTWAHFGVIP